MAEANLIEFIAAGVVDSAGLPLEGGKVYCYASGTTTAKTVYTDSAGSTSASNPFTLDERGAAQVYGSGSYKFVIKDSNDSTIVTLDDVPITSSEVEGVYYATVGGTANALTLTADSSFSYTSGKVVHFVAGGANTTAVTVNVNSLGAKDLMLDNANALIAGNLKTSNHYLATYGVDDNFYLVNPSWVSVTPDHYGGVSTNVSDAFSITLAPTPTAYKDGMLISWTHNSDNTGSSTININSSGAKQIQTIGGYALTAGQLKANDTYVAIYYSDIFYLLNPNTDVASTWSPTLGASGSMTFTSTTVHEAKYGRDGRMIEFVIDVEGTIGGTPSYILTFTLPVEAATADNEIFVGKYSDDTAGTGDTNIATMAYASTTTIASISGQVNANNDFNAGVCRYKVSGRYRSAQGK